MPSNDALLCAKCDNWFAAMDDELQFMKDISLAYLVEFSKNEIEKDFMNEISYAFAVETLMPPHVCIRPDISYAVSILY